MFSPDESKVIFLSTETPIVSVGLRNAEVPRGGSRISSQGGAQLKKLRRAEGGAKIFGIFRVKNHDFTPKNHIFPILGGAREIFGVFHVKNHDFTPKKSYFFQFQRGRAPGAPPPESAPGTLHEPKQNGVKIEVGQMLGQPLHICVDFPMRKRVILTS